MAGSTWNRWDLHIHAPGTKKEDRYNGLSIEDFCRELVDTELKAVGITDYFSAESALRVRSVLQEMGSEIQVFPNVEFRSSHTPNQKRLNYHAIFSNELSDGQIRDALTRVKVRTKEGKAKFLNELDDETLNSAIVDYYELTDSLADSFDAWPVRPYIIVVPGGSDGFRNRVPKDGVPSPMGQTEAHNIIASADAIFGNKKDHDYWTNPSEYDEKPRPVYRGSDAHSLDGLNAAQENGDFTWIKGEIGFPALCETLIEPGSRVAIQLTEPDEKSVSNVIERVSIESKDRASGKFNQHIYLNGNLNSVIGSRSAGKSILGAAISAASSLERTIEMQESANPARLAAKGKSPRLSQVYGPAAGWSWDAFLSEVDITLRWGDGRETSTEEEYGRVVYIPQGYLNSLAENPREIETLLERAVQEHSDKAFAEKFDEMKQAWSACRVNVSDCVERVVRSVKLRNQAQSILESVGSKEELNKRLNELREKSSILRGSDLTEDTKMLLDEVSDAKRRLDSWGSSDVSGWLAQLENLSLPARPVLNREAESVLGRELDRAWRKAAEGFVSECADIFTDYSQASDYAKKVAEQCVEEWASEIRLKNGGEIPEVNSDEASQNDGKISIVTADLNKVIKAEEDLVRAAENIDSELKSIHNFRRQYFDDVHEALNISRPLIDLVEVGIEFGFDPGEIPDTSVALKKQESSEWCVYSEEYLPNLSEGELCEFEEMQPLLKVLSKKGIALRANSSLTWSDLLLQVGCLVPEPRIFGVYEGDRFGGYRSASMSAGKRALASLSLLLSNSGDGGPIVLDQPEDDLDSRSIANEVVPYLRRAKQARQIIMVSHNANLVVGSDSELVIVANQASGDHPNEDGLRFFYGAGPIESKPSGRKNSFFSQASVKGHICDLLDGGLRAFEKRATRYVG